MLHQVGDEKGLMVEKEASLGVGGMLKARLCGEPGK
jgi:hypothetical protein